MDKNPLVDRLTAVLGPPRNIENFQLFVAEYRKQLDVFGPTALAMAADGIIRQLGKSWPTVKDCVEAAEVAQASIAGAQQAIDAGRPETTLPWKLHDSRAHTLAVEFCKTTMIGDQAFREGWGRALYLYARSWAREHLRADREPDMTALRTSEEFVAYHQRYSCAPDYMRWVDRVALLGEPLYQAKQENREEFGEPEPLPERVGSFRRPDWTAASRPAWEKRFGKPLEKAREPKRQRRAP